MLTGIGKTSHISPRRYGILPRSSVMKALGTNGFPIRERRFDHDLYSENSYSTMAFSGLKAFNTLVVVKGVCACMGTDNGRAV